MNLRTSLIQERAEHNQLISIGALQRLVTESSVQECLSSAKIPFGSDLVSHIVSCCPKIFAILVLLEMEEHIIKLFNQRLTDSIFPVASKDVPPFRNEKNRVDFYDTQWCIPPRIDAKSHPKLHRNEKLPYTRKEGDQRNGACGLVDKVTILEGHLAEWPEGEPIAVKRIRIDGGRMMDVCLREIETLRKREHKNIVKLLASFTETRDESGYEHNFLHLMFPWAEINMDEWMKVKHAPDWLLTQTRNEQRKYLYTVLHDLISALAYLHKEIEGKLTSHHDLKPNNVLVYREKLVIADLGCSHLRSAEMGSETEVFGLGTYAYLPPECLTDNGLIAGGLHGRSLDVWAMGCIMIEVAILIAYGWESGKVMQFRESRKNNPIDRRRFQNLRFKGCEDDSFHNNILVVDNWLTNLRGDGSNQLKKTVDLIARMLDFSPEKRPYSWEAKLDIYEILHPDASDEDRRKICEDTVPQPPKKKLKNISTPLHRAASEGDSTRAEILVERGWLSDIKDATGYTPAQLAKKSGHQQLATFLLQSETRSDYVSPGIRRVAKLLRNPFKWKPIHNSREEDLCYYVKENDLPPAQGLLNRHTPLSSFNSALDTLSQQIKPLENDITVPSFTSTVDALQRQPKQQECDVPVSSFISTVDTLPQQPNPQERGVFDSSFISTVDALQQQPKQQRNDVSVTPFTSTVETVQQQPKQQECDFFVSPFTSTVDFLQQQPKRQECDIPVPSITSTVDTLQQKPKQQESDDPVPSSISLLNTSQPQTKQQKRENVSLSSSGPALYILSFLFNPALCILSFLFNYALYILPQQTKQQKREPPLSSFTATFDTFPQQMKQPEGGVPFSSLTSAIISYAMENDRVVRFTPWIMTLRPGYIDQVKRILEKWVRSPIIWWPLQPPRLSCPHGYVRISWTCACGTDLSVDVPVEMARDYQQKCSSASNNQSILPVHNTKIIGAPAGTSTQTQNVAQSSGGLSHRSSQQTALNPGTNGAIGTKSSLQPDRYVHWCVDANRYETELNHISIPTLDDSNFISKLKCAYWTTRGIRQWFSLTDCYGVRFVSFERINRSRDLIACGKEDLPCSKTNKDYVYYYRDPREQFIKTLEQSLIHCFHNPHSSCIAQNMQDIITRIPKKINGRLEQEYGALGYGMHAVPGWAVWKLMAALVLSQVGPLVFLIKWLCGHKGDLQNAFTLSMYLIALLNLIVVVPDVWSLRK